MRETRRLSFLLGVREEGRTKARSLLSFKRRHVAHLQRPEIVQGILPPSVVGHCSQNGFGGQAGGGQHLHGFSCGSVQQFSCCTCGGACRRCRNLKGGETFKTNLDSLLSLLAA